MAEPEKNRKVIRKIYEDKTLKVPERIRLGNVFVDDFIFEEQEAADIPINALRVIFNIISIIGSEQFRPEDRPKQLCLFEDDFETENNTYASIKIRNSKISPSGSTKQVIDAYEFLAKFKMTWYKSVNSKGREIKTFGGLISTPSYDHRGYTTFLISSYWLKKLMVIPEYNYVLYNLVYNIKNNKHIIFAIWLAKIPATGTALRLSTFNRKFGLNYKSANDFCFKFLKPARSNFDQFNNISFTFRYSSDLIYIVPYHTKMIAEGDKPLNYNERSEITRRLGYIRKRYGLEENDMIQFSFQYRTIEQTREMIENSFKEFIRRNRMKGISSTNFQGKAFLNEIQKIIIDRYMNSRMGKLLPNGYPVIV